MHQPRIHLLGYGSGIAAGNPGCGDGPDSIKAAIKSSGLFNHLPWDKTFYPKTNLSKLLIVADLCQQLAMSTKTITQEREKFIVFGGDHSSAIGTWSGVQSAIKNQGNLGLIWFDAHLDSHTLETSLSGNIHGMPVASLLGYGAPELTHIENSQPTILPENLCIIGARSYESGELDLIKQLGVKVFYIDEVLKLGINRVMKEAIQHVSKDTIGYGLSIDLDGFDPLDAPGVGTPEINGISADAFLPTIQGLLNEKRLYGIEIVEYNPHLDNNHKTEKLILQLISCLMQNKEQNDE